MRVLCETCEGTGRVRPNPFNQREMVCPRECDDGYRPAEPADLDGKRGYYRGWAGDLHANGDRLTLECDNGVSIVNLTVEDVA